MYYGRKLLSYTGAGLCNFVTCVLSSLFSCSIKTVIHTGPLVYLSLMHRDARITSLHKIKIHKNLAMAKSLFLSVDSQSYLDI